MTMQTSKPRGAVHGILHQFRELGDVLAVALLDEDGDVIAAAGDDAATAALSSAISRLLRDVPGDENATKVERLFEDSDEFNVPRGPASAVSLLVRRVGEDWALAAIWTSDTPLGRLRSFAAETASRLEAVS